MKTTTVMPVVIIVATFALIISLNLKRRAKEKQDEREGKPPTGIPKVIVAFWMLLGLALILLLLWSPKK